MTSHEAYKLAQKRIRQNKHDFKDEMIVALWDKMAEALTSLSDMKKMMDEYQRAAAKDHIRIDILESRLAKFNGTLTPEAPFWQAPKSSAE